LRIWSLAVAEALTIDVWAITSEWGKWLAVSPYGEATPTPPLTDRLVARKSQTSLEREPLQLNKNFI